MKAKSVGEEMARQQTLGSWLRPLHSWNREETSTHWLAFSIPYSSGRPDHSTVPPTVKMGFHRSINPVNMMPSRHAGRSVPGDSRSCRVDSELSRYASRKTNWRILLRSSKCKGHVLLSPTTPVYQPHGSPYDHMVPGILLRAPYIATIAIIP